MRTIVSRLAEVAGIAAISAGLALEVGFGWGLVAGGAYVAVAGFMQGVQ